MKSQILTLGFTLLISICCQGQIHEIDSLKNVLQQTQSDTARILILKNISWAYLNTRSNTDTAEKYIDSVYLLSNATNFQKGIDISNYQYGVLHRQKGTFDSALVFFDKYLKSIAPKNDSIAIANALYQKAIVYDYIGDVDKSLELYHTILSIYQNQNDRYSIATVLNSLGQIYKLNKKYDEAMKSYQDALKIYQDLEMTSDVANCYYNIGDAYSLQNEYAKALNYFNLALEIDHSEKNMWGIAYDYEAMGKVYSNQGFHDEALEAHLKALKIRSELNQKKELAFSHILVAIDYERTNQSSLALDHLEKAVTIADEIGAKAESQQAYEELSKIYKKKGDFQQALIYKERAIVLKDSLFNETKSRQIQELQTKFETQKKQDAITTLQKDAEIKNLRLKRQTTLRNITIGTTIGVLLFFLVLFNRYKHKQRAKQEAEEKKRMLADERRKTAIEKQRVTELQKIDKLKDEFLANTSHELRTPLNGIIGITESLKDGVAGPLSPEAIENLCLIENSGKRLAHLVNDILDFSKLKNKDLTLSINAVDLYPISNLVLKLMTPLLNGKSVEIINKINKEVPLINADENRLQQILYNLIGNAIKFTESGTITISTEERDKFLVIHVEDTGIGIPDDKINTIFNSFEQVDSSSERKYGGTGLGLAVTKQLVALHGGDIWVKSSLNKGSRFSFTIPISPETKSLTHSTDHIQADTIQSQLYADINEEPVLHSDPKDTNSSNQPIKILIVDDEVINRKVLHNHLSFAGYEISEVSNGTQALSVLEKEKDFDLILLDIMMPGISGYEVCQRIREEHLPNDLPIILLTAKNRISDLVNGFQVGANDYLTKPFSKNELLSRIKTHLNLKGIHRATSKFVPTEFLKSVGREIITEVKLGDHIQKNITVLFSDIRDYTTLAETMSPKQNFKFVNAYVGRMGPIVKKYEGFVNQYMGDGIMALFPDNASLALSASIEMQRCIIEYNKRRVQEGFKPISAGVGLHTGPLIMGVIGDSHRNDTAIIADTVNTASRMEGVTKFYGAKIILSENSLQTIENQDQFNLRYLGKVRVKGKIKAIGIYECFDGDAEEQVALKLATLTTFNNGMQHYFNQEFPKATSLFDAVLSENPNDQVAKYFLTISAEYTINGVPDNWEDVNILTEK